jgi:hypothetical protein
MNAPGFARLLLVLALPALAAGCRADSGGEPGRDPAPRSARGAIDYNKVVAKAPAPAPTAGGGSGSLGELGARLAALGPNAPDKTKPTTLVPECDRMLEAMETCYLEKMPAGTKENVLSALAQARDTYRKAAETEAGRSSMAMACKQAMVQMRSSLEAMGCKM